MLLSRKKLIMISPQNNEKIRVVGRRCGPCRERRRWPLTRGMKSKILLEHLDEMRHILCWIPHHRAINCITRANLMNVVRGCFCGPSRVIIIKTNAIILHVGKLHLIRVFPEIIIPNVQLDAFREGDRQERPVGIKFLLVNHREKCLEQ